MYITRKKRDVLPVSQKHVSSSEKKAFRLIYGVADVDQSREMGTVAVSAPTFIPI